MTAKHYEQETHLASKRPFEQTEPEATLLPPEKMIKLSTGLIDKTLDTQENDMLSAYKRIWDSLDLTKEIDAKLEPYIWNKIREYRKKRSS